MISSEEIESSIDRCAEKNAGYRTGTSDSFIMRPCNLNGTMQQKDKKLLLCLSEIVFEEIIR